MEASGNALKPIETFTLTILPARAIFWFIQEGSQIRMGIDIMRVLSVVQ